MTVKELKEQLERIPDDNIVSIRIQNPGNFVCPDGAVVGIKSARRGIDWHGHEFLLIPENRLIPSNVEKWSKGEVE